MKINKLQIFLVFFIVMLSACKEETTSDGDTIVCTASIDPAIRIQVLDKETGFAISCGAKAVISEGDFSEEVENPAGENCNDSQMLIGADERSGTYDLMVSKEGYLDWYATNIQVSANLCHVNTVTVQAYMEK